MKTKTRQELFDYMSQEHGVALLETDMEELENIILKEYKKELIEKMTWENVDNDTLNDIIELIEADETLNHKTD